MRELVKSMIRFSWTMSLFGMKQTANVFSYRDGKIGARAADAFDEVTRSTEGQLGGLTRGMYRAGERFQSAMVDWTFDAVTLGWVRSDRDRSSGEGQDESLGWGPVPPAPNVE